MGSYIIAVDRGSTNTKAVVFDTCGEEILVSSVASQKPISVRTGWWEQDMDQVWKTASEAIRGVFAKGICPKDILGVITVGHGNGLMSIDCAGNPVGMGIHSLDCRADGVLGQWMEDGRYDKAIHTVGMPFPVGSPLPLMAWLMENAPETVTTIDKILFSKDWVNYKLCGVIGTDPSDASGAGLMDIRKGRYAYEIFDMLGLAAIVQKLPEIRLSHEILGHVTEQAAEETGLLAGTPVLVGAHDIAAFPLGIGAVDIRQIVSAVGTWGLNLIPVKSPNDYSAVLYHTVPDYYLTGAGDGNSGGCLDIMLQHLCTHERVLAEQKGISIYEYIEDMVTDCAPTGILFHPFLFGSAQSSSVGAGFTGLKNWHRKADLLLSVLEGIVMGHWANIRMIPGYADIEFIWLVGGGARLQVFGRLFADITGLRIKVPAAHEITARGGALCALVGLGLCKDYTQAAIPARIRAEYQPDPKRHIFYKKKFEIFQELIRSNQDVWEKLETLEG